MYSNKQTNKHLDKTSASSECQTAVVAFVNIVAIVAAAICGLSDIL